ncbi:hypothetical protein [Azotobacter vinelandii]
MWDAVLARFEKQAPASVMHAWLMLMFAFLYNALGIPIAASVLYPHGLAAVAADRCPGDEPELGFRDRQRLILRLRKASLG